MFEPNFWDLRRIAVRVENRLGLDALDDILTTDVDGVFIGPSDLAADMGHIGNAGHTDVVEAVLDALKRIVAAGKAAGILTLDPVMQRKCVDLGVTFLATNIDVTLFAKAMRGAAETALEMLPDQSASGNAPTDVASKYLQQLCKHWSYKGQVEFDVTEGKVSFENGCAVAMKATDEGLDIVASVGPRGDLNSWKVVIEDHLKRFAFREEFKVDWSA